MFWGVEAVAFEVASCPRFQAPLRKAVERELSESACQGRGHGGVLGVTLTFHRNAAPGGGRLQREEKLLQWERRVPRFENVVDSGKLFLTSEYCLYRFLQSLLWNLIRRI